MKQEPNTEAIWLPKTIKYARKPWYSILENTNNSSWAILWFPFLMMLEKWNVWANFYQWISPLQIIDQVIDFSNSGNKKVLMFVRDSEQLWVVMNYINNVN